jgi:hypothetical protein
VNLEYIKSETLTEELVLREDLENGTEIEYEIKTNKNY